MLLPQGTQIVEVVGGLLGQNEKTQSKFVGLVFEVVKGQYTGERVTSRRYLTPDAQQYTYRDLRFLGWEGETRTQSDGSILLLLPKKPIPIGIKHEAGTDGKSYSAVDWIGVAPGRIPDEQRLKGPDAERLARELAVAFKSEREPRPVADGGDIAAV